MKKQYITPTILGHRIITPTILAGSPGENNILSTPSHMPISQGTGTNPTSANSKRSSFFDDETEERNDFAYGL